MQSTYCVVRNVFGSGDKGGEMKWQNIDKCSYVGCIRSTESENTEKVICKRTNKKGFTMQELSLSGKWRGVTFNACMCCCCCCSMELLPFVFRSYDDCYVFPYCSRRRKCTISVVRYSVNRPNAWPLPLPEPPRHMQR